MRLVKAPPLADCRVYVKRLTMQLQARPRALQQVCQLEAEGNPSFIVCHEVGVMLGKGDNAQTSGHMDMPTYNVSAKENALRAPRSMRLRSAILEEMAITRSEKRHGKRCWC